MHSTREAHLAGGVAAVAGVYAHVERPTEGSPDKGHLQLPRERHPDSPYVHQSHLTSGVAAVAGVIPLSRRPAERVRPHPSVPAERGKPKKGRAPSREQHTNLRVAGPSDGTGLPIDEIEPPPVNRTAPVHRPPPMHQQPNRSLVGAAPPKAGVRPQRSQLTNDLAHVEAPRHEQQTASGGGGGGQAWLDVRGALPHRAPGDWVARGTNTTHQLSTNLVPAEHAGEVPLVGEHLGRGPGADLNDTTAFQVGRGMVVPADPRGDFTKANARVLIKGRGPANMAEVPDADTRVGVGGRGSERARFMRHGSGTVVNPDRPVRPHQHAGRGSGGAQRNHAVVRGGEVAARPYDGEALANGVFAATKNRDHFHGHDVGYEGDEVIYAGRYDDYAEGAAGADTFAGASSHLANRGTAGEGGSSKRTVAHTQRMSPRSRRAYLAAAGGHGGRPFEYTNTILDSQSGDAPEEYATNPIFRSRREHDHNETTLKGILMHVGEGLDAASHHVVDLDEGLPAAFAVDRQTPRGQHQTTAVVGGGVVPEPRQLTVQEQRMWEATREESARTQRIFDAVRARNGSRFSPGKRRRSFGAFRRHDGAYYAGQPPSFQQSFREFQKLDRERQRAERQREEEEQAAHERRCQLDLERLTTVEGRLFLFYRKHAPHLIPKIPDLLEQWQGREDTLFHRIRKKYRAPLDLPEHWTRRRPGDSRGSSRQPSRAPPAKSPRARPESDEHRRRIYGTSSNYGKRPYRPRTAPSARTGSTANTNNTTHTGATNYIRGGRGGGQGGDGGRRVIDRRVGRGEVGVAVPVEQQRSRSRSRAGRARHPELSAHDLYSAGVEGPLTGGATRPPTQVHLRPPSGERRVIRRPPRRDDSDGGRDGDQTARIEMARMTALRKRQELLQSGAQVEY